MRRLGSVLRTSAISCGLGVATGALAMLWAATANAASLQKVNQSAWWGSVTGLPTYVNMYTYVPDQLATKPPIVVAPHHCQGTAQSTYSEMASLESIADKTGFLIIFPEATGENCWDAGSTRSLKHGGGGDTGAVVQMVTYALSKYSADPARVYSVGGSSGGIMTEALLGVYPDVFMAGVSLMGVPCGCWADGYSDVTGTGSTAQWSGACAGGNVTKTGQAWGDLVRSYYAGYTGHRPRLQHWHGTADTTLNYKNLAEDVKEWTNLLGLSETPNGTDTPKSGTTRQFWKNSCGYTVYETFSLSGVGHAVPFDGNAVAAYFGLDKATSVDPETAACGGGTGGLGGAGGTGGSSGAGGRSASGAGGMGGSQPSGGQTGTNAGGGGSAGTLVATGGAGSGAPGVGGQTSSSGGASGSPNGGTPSFGGSSVISGSGAGGTAATAAGAPNHTGASGAGNAGSAGTASTGGPATAGASGDATPNASDTQGCGCRVADPTSGSFSGAFALALSVLGIARRRRR